MKEKIMKIITKPFKGLKWYEKIIGAPVWHGRTKPLPAMAVQYRFNALAA